LVEFRSSSD